MTMGMLLGAAFSVVIILLIQISRHILWCRKMDRRFVLEMKMKDDLRNQGLRDAGVAEADILSLQKKMDAIHEEYLKG